MSANNEPMGHEPVVPGLEHAFDVEVIVDAPDDYGFTSRGHRRIVNIVGGSITGLITAEILPGGADWQIIRENGTIEIDGRYSARTDQGELIYLQVSGVRSGSEEVLSALGAGENISPDKYYFRTTVTFETSAPKLRHLEDSIFVASCLREANRVRYGSYRVS